ncbi:hypothetical protein IVB56_25305 [Bradyrhizobium sp. CW7]|uniref:hypothetical protein n=1 Tax=Bradyrhizobium sp. CW7 TaxID=2782688 RepID=UPI001FF9B7DB|nr:hypothetical protein [Bradyrhizobium sp. CW7]MCK1354278.1 hypothetical protein [Bradyrhizobium sp. CW7]
MTKDANQTLRIASLHSERKSASSCHFGGVYFSQHWWLMASLRNEAWMLFAIRQFTFYLANRRAIAENGWRMSADEIVVDAVTRTGRPVRDPQ